MYVCMYACMYVCIGGPDEMSEFYGGNSSGYGYYDYYKNGYSSGSGSGSGSGFEFLEDVDSATGMYIRTYTYLRRDYAEQIPFISTCNLYCQQSL